MAIIERFIRDNTLMNRSYLAPILAFIPLAIIIFTLVRLEYDLSPLFIGMIVIVYLAANVLYTISKKTFRASLLVKLTLVSLIGYFVLINLL